MTYKSQTISRINFEWLQMKLIRQKKAKYGFYFYGKPMWHFLIFPILGLANAPIVETKFLELAMSLLDFSPRIPLGTFSILLNIRKLLIYFLFSYI